MKKLFCIAAVLLLAALIVAAFWTVRTVKASAVQMTAGWYDEEINLGYNSLDGYYTVVERASDYTPEERAARNMSEHYEARITHLCKESVEAIQNGELGV